MAVDLMEMVKGAVSKQIMGKIGGLLGTDESKTSSAFETIAGSILGGLMKKASTPQGADVIFESAQKQDDSVLDKLGDLLGGGEATEAYESAGGNVLETIFGGDHSGIMDVLTKAVGLDGNLVGKLLKMAAPIIMSVIGKYMKSKALDASGLGGLLGEQKQYLGNYLPTSLTSDLGLGDMLGSASQNVAAAGQSAAPATKKKGGLLKRLALLLIILLAGAGVIRYFVMPLLVEQSTNDIDRQKLENLRKPNPDAVIRKSLRNGFTQISTGMTNLKDDEGATDLAKMIDNFTGSIDELPIGELKDKTTVTSMISNSLKKIEELLEKLPDELKSIVQPAVEAMVDKLDLFSGETPVVD